MSPTRVATGLLTALALTAATGCTGTVEGSDVEKQITATAQKQEVDTEDVSCPDLKAEKGEKSTCTFTVDGQKYRLVVEVRSVDGRKVSYHLDAPEVEQ